MQIETPTQSRARIEGMMLASLDGLDVWTWPYDFGMPLLYGIIEGKYPRLVPVPNPIPGWIKSIQDKMKEWFSSHSGISAGSKIEVHTRMIQAMDWAASQINFDVWGAGGLPSLPAYQLAPEE